MADTEDAIDTATAWWLLLRDLARVGPHQGDDAEGFRRDAVEWLWWRLDPLARRPIADEVFPRDGGVSFETGWAFVITPRPIHSHEFDFSDFLVERTVGYFREELTAIRRLAIGMGLASDPVTVEQVRAHVNVDVTTDYALASSLFDRVEQDADTSGLPIWFSYPDDLAIVEFRHLRPHRFLMSRRRDEWYVILPPETFDVVDGRRSGDDGGEAAGVREPRNPFTPVLTDQAALDDPLR